MPETLELIRPHGFLLWRGKKAAIARPAGLELAPGQDLQITTDGEVFGSAVLGNPVTVQAAEFDDQKWFRDHRVYPREREAWWPGAAEFLVYPVQEFTPLSQPEWMKAEAPGYGPAQGIDRCSGCLEYSDGFCRLHDRVVEDDQVCEDYQGLEDWRGGEDQETESPFEQKEAEAMPYEKREVDGRWCVFKKDTNEPMKCYDSEDRADAYLTALRINVEAAEKAVDLATRAREITEALGLTDARVTEIVRDYLISRANDPPTGEKAEVTKSEGDGDHPKGHYLVVEDPEKPSTWHLRVRNVDGELDHRLMGGAWAALHGGYRGNKYAGPDKQDALARLKKLYESEGLELPGEGEKQEGAIGGIGTKESGQITKEDGQGEAGACECPECGKEFGGEKSTACSERSCPDCDVPLVGSDGEEEAEEGAEEGVEEEKSAPIPIPATSTKAGSRIKRSMKDRIRDALETLKEVLGWAEYDDQKQPGGLDTFFKMDSNYQSGMGIKAVGDDPWMFTWTTNAFKDRQKEIFSTKCLEQYVTEAEAKDDRGTYDLWHIKGTDFASVKWQGVVGRFLVEAGPFHDTPIGRAAKAFFTRYPDGHPVHAPEGWGSSPEFRYLPEERKSGTYNWIWIVRRSVLPRAAAANVWTRGTEVSAMALTKQQEELGKEILGEELLSQVIQEAESRSKELEQAGIAHKAADADIEAEAEMEEFDGEDEDELEEESEVEEEFETEDEGKAETNQVEVDVKAVAEQLASIFEVKLDPIVELAEQVQNLAADVKALRGELQAMKGQKAVQAKAETPRFVLNLTKKASDAEETLVEPEDPLMKMKPVEAQPRRVSGASHFFGTG